MAHVFHITTRPDWEEALRTGTYTTSTAGRTLAEEGFIHACRRDQVQDVFTRYYTDVDEELHLLTINPARLEAEVREEVVGAETYPHIYGPINTSAVVSVDPMNRFGGVDSFLMVFIKEAGKRMVIASAVLLVLALAVVLIQERLI